MSRPGISAENAGDRKVKLLENRHNCKFPNMSKPNIVGHFSVDNERNYRPTAENLKYLKLPEKIDFPLDLNRGYEEYVHKPESALDEKIDHLLQFILVNKENLLAYETSETFLKFDFVCFRGLLRQVMCTPYENQDDWCILATKHRGNIYLCQIETEQKRWKRLQEDDNSKKFCSYGFKFEQYLLSDDPQKKPDTNQPVIESEEFCCLYETTLEGNRVLYGAEMDGIISDSLQDFTTIDLNKQRFIELKASITPITHNQRRNYAKYKLRNWWCQSFLVGIRDIFVGFRDAKGLVNEVTKMDVRSFPKEAMGQWYPNVCMDYLVQFLEIVRKIAELDCPYTVYKFYFNPRERNVLSVSKYVGRNELTFMPDWYIDQL